MNKTFWVTYTNSDLTEGRGREIPLAVCELKSTAIRLGKNNYVQGSDCPVRQMELFEHEGKLYVPFSIINVIPPTKVDIVKQETEDKKNEVLSRIKQAGFSEEDIKILKST